MIKFVHKNGLCYYFAMDIKNNLKDYAKIIGFDKFDTKNVQNSIEYFLSNDLDYEFRTTLIKEFHSKENIQNIAKEISGAKKYFLQKFKNGENCIDATSLNPIDNSTVLEFVNILTPYVPNVKTRGYDL
jgi:pyruvate formate lyase activating enzyme